MLSIKPDLVVLWIDAHGDINTPETSPSKSYHGMPVAHLLGRFKKQAIGFEWMNHIPILKESDLAYIGLRSLDTDEKRVISNSKIAAFSMKDVDRHGMI